MKLYLTLKTGIIIIHGMRKRRNMPFTAERRAPLMLKKKLCWMEMNWLKGTTILQLEGCL